MRFSKVFNKIPSHLLFVAIMLLSPVVSSRALASDSIDFFISDSARYYKQVAITIADQINRNHPDVQISYHDLDGESPVTLGEESLIVSIGTTASLNAAVNFPHQPQLSLFITEAAWKSLPADLSSSRKAALFIDQPVDRMVALGRVLAPRAHHYATAFGPVSVGHKSRLDEAANRMGVELVSAEIELERNPLAALTPLFENADLFIALPDKGIFNRSVGKWVLHLAFKHKIPVIGFSSAYRDAGAAASLYTSTADIIRQASDWLGGYLMNNDFNDWNNHSPTYFTIAINPTVTRNLGLGTPDVRTLHTGVEQLLGESGP